VIARVWSADSGFALANAAARNGVGGRGTPCVRRTRAATTAHQGNKAVTDEELYRDDAAMEAVMQRDVVGKLRKVDGVVASWKGGVGESFEVGNP